MNIKRIKNIRSSMLGRCYTISAGGYSYYGGKGITVCDEWKKSIDSFVDWAINNGYSDNLTIDRIDSCGNYSPDNCRWPDKYTQAINQRKRSTNKSGYIGVSFYKRDSLFTCQISVKGKQIWIGRFNKAIDAAIARNKFIIKNDTNHTLNKIEA